MYGFPLDTAKKLLSDLVNVLRPTDTFNIVVFASGFEVFSPVSVPATHCQSRRARCSSSAARTAEVARGCWMGCSARLRCRASRVSRSVVLLTDGYIDAEADVFDYIREQLRRSELLRVRDRQQREPLSDRRRRACGSWRAFHRDQAEDAPEAAEQLRRYIETPVLTGIDVRFAGFDVYDVEPGKIPDLFASRPIVVFGKWRGAIGGSIEISGRTGRGGIRRRFPSCPRMLDASHAALRHLWARTRIANLSDFGPATPSQDRISEITSLGTDLRPADEAHVVHCRA